MPITKNRMNSAEGNHILGAWKRDLQELLGYDPELPWHDMEGLAIAAADGITSTWYVVPTPALNNAVTREGYPGFFAVVHCFDGGPPHSAFVDLYEGFQVFTEAYSFMSARVLREHFENDRERPVTVTVSVTERQFGVEFAENIAHAGEES